MFMTHDPGRLGSAHVCWRRWPMRKPGRGVMEDKVIKNIFSTEYIWHSIKKQKTVGVIDENEMEGYVEVAEPVGVVAGVTPVNQSDLHHDV